MDFENITVTGGESSLLFYGNYIMERVEISKPARVP